MRFLKYKLECILIEKLCNNMQYKGSPDLDCLLCLARSNMALYCFRWHFEMVQLAIGITLYTI